MVGQIDQRVGAGNQAHALRRAAARISAEHIEHVGPDRTPILTLPGNPVSAFVSFEVFVRPVLRRMLGVEPLHRPTVRAVLTSSVDSPEGRRQYLRADLEVEDGRYVARPVGGPGSHLLVGLSQSNAFVVIPEDVGHVAAGEAVTVMMLERRTG